MNKPLIAYLLLERLMIEADNEDDEYADALRDGPLDFLWNHLSDEDRTQLKCRVGSRDEKNPTRIMVADYHITAEVPNSGNTIDGREKLLYDLRDSLSRLMSVIKDTDEAKATWAYEYAQSMLHQTEEWLWDEEHAFGEKWIEKRKSLRQQFPK